MSGKNDGWTRFVVDMPREYRAIKEFVRLGEGSDGFVVSCIVTTGSEP